MEFVDLDAIKNALGIPAADTSRDVALQGIAAGVNGELLTWFGLSQCGETTYTRSYDVLDGGTRGIWLDPWPVTGITSVSVHGSTLDAGTYYLDQRLGVNGQMGMLLRKSGGAPAAFMCWPAGAQGVTVVHTAGWALAPDPQLQRAALLLALYHANVDSKQGYKSETIGQYRYELGSGAGSGEGAGGAEAGGWPGPVARIMAQWTRPFAEGN